MTTDPKPKTKRLKGKDYTKFRLEVCDAHHWRCDECHRWLPPYDQDGNFNKYTCGHVAHKKSRGAGGPDTPENVAWKCWTCHMEIEHGPKWSKE